jgi:hypothetical protein
MSVIVKKLVKYVTSKLISTKSKLFTRFGEPLKSDVILNITIFLFLTKI